MQNLLPESLTNLSNETRVWVYQANELFNADIAQSISNNLNYFVARWKAHGKQLTGNAFVLGNAFVILTLSPQSAAATGCSIDDSVSFVKQIGKNYSIDFFSRKHIAYIKNNKVSICKFEDFNETDDTLVFENHVSTVEALKTNWLVPFKQSGLKNLIESSKSFNLTL